MCVEFRTFGIHAERQRMFLRRLGQNDRQLCVHGRHCPQVLEKLDAPGGRAYVWKQDGFTFDAGPTIIRIPTGADGGSAATPASAEVPAVPAPR